jgi:teichuronic acid exporter
MSSESPLDIGVPEAARAIELNNAGDVQARAVSGVRAMGLRTLVSVFLRVVSSLCLAHLLFPRDYGVFGVVTSITGLTAYLRDVGLGGALVRQEHPPTEDQMSTVFWCQQILTGILVAALLLATPLLISLYKLSAVATGLLIWMSIGMFLSSLRVVPMVVLERALRFDTIARCEMIENVSMTASTIVLALLHAGPWALTGGGLISSAVGLYCVWAVSPWRPRGRFVTSIAVNLARFGIPFQLNALVPSLLNNWMPLAVTRLLGPAAFGLLGWAGNIASVPLMLSAILNRIAFPAYSRLQSNSESLGASSLSSVRRIVAVLGLSVPLFVIICPFAIPFAFGGRWLGAVPLVQWLSMEVVAQTAIGLLAQTQNASGRPTERLYVTLGAGALRAGFGVLVLVHFGLYNLMPLLYGVSCLELLMTTLLVMRAFPGSGLLLKSGLGAILQMNVLLALALLGGSLLPQSAPVLLRVTVQLLLFAALTAAVELATGERPITREMRGILLMLRRTTQTHRGNS